jgi:hypothetical protein
MTGLETFIAMVRQTPWSEIERESGLTQAAIRRAGEIYIAAERVIGVYGMGLTQHSQGALNVAMIVNLLLLRGNIGREGAGCCPVRGHSNVQGQRTVGIAEKTKLIPMDKLKQLFDFDPPTKDGTTIVDAVKGLMAGSIKAFISLGGNLVRAVPDKKHITGRRVSHRRRRSPTEQRVALGSNRDGKLTALIHSGVTPQSPHSALPEPFIVPTRSAYAVDNMTLDVQTCRLDMLANTFMRAPGEAVGTFALECAMDELAEQLGIDPIALRTLNEPQKDPIGGVPFSSRNIVEAYRIGAERFGWDRRAMQPGTRREGEWFVGMGCATATYPYYRMPGAAARITLSADGHATVDFAAHEMGMGTSTVQTQITADRLGLTMDQVTVRYGDSALPGVILAGGSQQTAAVGMAVMSAYNELVSELLKLAGNDSPLAGLGRDDVVGVNGGLAGRDRPDRSKPMSRSSRGLSDRSLSRKAIRRCPSNFSIGRCIPMARCSAKCGSMRSPANRVSAGSSVRSTAAASSIRKLRQASSAAASSWASAWR